MIKWLFGAREQGPEEWSETAPAEDKPSGSLKEDGDDSASCDQVTQELRFDRSRREEAAPPDRKRIKRCPRCGSLVFADMDICYGCLYMFDGSEEIAQEMLKDREDDLASFAEDETRPLEVFPELAGGPAHLKTDCASSRSSPRFLPGEDGSEDRSVAGAFPDARTKAVRISRKERLGVEVETPDIRVRCYVPSGGLTIGRDDDNDIVLRSPDISRRHLRIRTTPVGLMVEDQGATNLAYIDGEPLHDQAKLAFSSVLDVCGTQVRAVCLCA